MTKDLATLIEMLFLSVKFISFFHGEDESIHFRAKNKFTIHYLATYPYCSLYLAAYIGCDATLISRNRGGS